MLESIKHQGPKIEKEDISLLEKTIKNPLPSDYAMFLLRYNGGDPKPNCHKVEGTESAYIGDYIGIRYFYSIGGPADAAEIVKDTIKEVGIRWLSWIGAPADPAEKIRRSYDIIEHFKCFFGRIPNNFLPIGCDSTGGQICLSFGGEDRGSIWYWDHDGETEPPSYQNCYKVADSFDSMLAGLYEIEYD